MPHNAGLPGFKYSTSSTPQYAPADYANLPDPLKEMYDDGEESLSKGSGTSTSLKCERCGYGHEDNNDANPENLPQNLLIYSYSLMQRNGNYSTRREIVCAQCKGYSTIETWEEG
jgi:hypothetical protein